ncbi:uncharacterized protein [Amphiura filiformis]|uniref:uncharacterized protein n=1 Tax=Amphiura filiformis TaxID=82378 RepID=UPI003B214566
MLKFSYHLSSSESDLRPGEMSDTSSYNSSLKEGDHSCHECDKRKRALSKERTRLSRHHSRSRERLNYNNNRCNYDNTLTSPSSTTSNCDTSDGQESMTCTTSTSNSEMSSVSNSFYTRFTQLRSRSKSKDAAKSRGARERGESPDSSSRTKCGYDDDSGERRGRRGLWELQKAASRVIGPESRVGRWVGKLRSRSSEARLGSLKSRYSEIQNWDGWKFEDRAPTMPTEDQLASPALMVNNRPVSQRIERPVLGKKIIRSRSTEAVNWIVKEDRVKEFTRQLPVRKSFEKAMKNKIEFSNLVYDVSKPRLHSRFESEPNLAKSNMYEHKSSTTDRYLDVGDDREYHRHPRDIKRCESQNYDSSNARYTPENNQRNDTVPRRHRQSCRSAERGREIRRPVSCNLDDSPRRRLYQKNQRVAQNMTASRNYRRPPTGQGSPQHSPDIQGEVCRSGRYSVQEATIKYEKIQIVKPDDFSENKTRQRHHGRESRRNVPPQNRDQVSRIPRPDIRQHSSNSSRQHSSNSSRRHRDRPFDHVVEPKPVVARYIPPQITNNESHIKHCSLKPVPIPSIAKVSSTKKMPPQNLSTQVSASCTALHEIHTSNNLKRYHSEQQLKRRSLTSLSSVDSGTSCSDDRSSPNNSGKENELTQHKADNQSNTSSDSGYRSPTSGGNVTKDWKDLETLVLSSCFGEEVKVQKKPVVSTSDYESESGYDDKVVRSDASKNTFKQTAMRMKSTERFQESDEDQCDGKHQKNVQRRSPKKSKYNGQRNRPTNSNQELSLKVTSKGIDISNLTTKVRARLNHKAMSSAEMSVLRGDTLYLNRESLASRNTLWVRAYSTNTGDAGLVPTVILSSRMEDLV